MSFYSRFFALLVLCCPLLAGAAVTYTVTQFGNGTTTFTGSGGTVQAAADAWAANLNSANWARCRDAYGNVLSKYSISITGVSGSSVSYTLTAPAVPNASGCSAYSSSGTVNATQTGEPDPVVCGPNQERDPETNTCECKSIRNAGSFMVTGDHYDGCNNGCAMVLSSGWYDKTANTTWGSWSQSGFACTAGMPSVLTPNDPKVEAAKQCSAGTCPGTVNGQTVCVPCDKSKETGTGTKTESSSTTASGASTPGTASTSSESTTTRTECSNGSCTTTETTTVTGPNGDKTDKTTNTTEPQSDYCTRNPRADVCKGTESSWGGSCESGFTCDGDAVQCAQARASYELRCKITETDTEVIGKYNALKSEGLEALQLPAMNITPPVPEAFGGCPIQDITIDLGFGPMPFPLSYVCPYLEVIHRVVTSFGALFWLLIVFLKGD